MGTTWHLSCKCCNHDFYSGRLHPFLINGSSWATQNSLNSFDIFFDIPLFLECLFLTIGSIVFLPAPLHFFVIIALFILPICFYFGVDVLLPFRTIFTYLYRIIDTIMKEITLKIHCNNNDKCPKCKSVSKGVRSTSSCLIM